FLVATVTAALGPAPSGRRRTAGDVTAQLERAAASGLFLEHLSGGLLGGLVALLARLRRRAMEGAFARLRGGLGGRLRSGFGCGLRGRGCGGRLRFGGGA